MAKISMKMGKEVKTEKYKGNIHLDSDTFKEAKNFKIGDKVKLMVEIEVTGLRVPDKWEVSEEGKSKDCVQVSSEIINISPINAIANANNS